MSFPLSAVIPAAGLSRRLGFDKLLTPVSGITFLQYTLQRVLKSPLVGEIIVVINPATESSVQEIIGKLTSSLPIKIVHGGAERQNSVLAGLLATNPEAEQILIHDAARPFVTPELIELVAEGARESGAAVCGHSCTDTLKEASDDQMIARTLDREKIWAVQTPQVFKRELIIDAYERVISGGKTVTDDTAAISEVGVEVKLVRFEGINLKITRSSDWAVASQLLMSMDEDIKMCADIRKLIHDISNQMTSIMGFSFLLDMDIPDDSPLKDHVRALNESSQKCHAIVGSMQNLARDMYAKKSGSQEQMVGLPRIPK